MRIKTIIRATAILLALLFNTALAQTFEEGVSAYNGGDYETAFEVFHSLADQGMAEAQFNLALMYDNGDGVTQDYSEAVHWYKAAAQQGNASAQYNLGVRYDEGKGVAEDDSEAVRWYRAAAEQGYADAQTNLAVMYAIGRGVIKDNITAHMWFNIASAHGEQNAKEGREMMADRMSREAIEEAQSRARTCMKSAYQDCD
jgi:TPR repeat protein